MIKLGLLIMMGVLGALYALINIRKRAYINVPSYVIPLGVKWGILVVHTLISFISGAVFLNTMLKAWTPNLYDWVLENHYTVYTLFTAVVLFFFIFGAIIRLFLVKRHPYFTKVVVSTNDAKALIAKYDTAEEYFRIPFWDVIEACESRMELCQELLRLDTELLITLYWDLLSWRRVLNKREGGFVYRYIFRKETTEMYEEFYDFIIMQGLNDFMEISESPDLLARYRFNPLSMPTPIGVIIADVFHTKTGADIEQLKQTKELQYVIAEELPKKEDMKEIILYVQENMPKVYRKFV